MTSKKIEILMPSYLLKFQCIGSECEDTCCKGWRVDIDKDTYMKYRSTENKLLKPMFDEYIVENELIKNDNLFGMIKMDENRSCPFLTEELLCQIQKTLGAEYLSKTCWSYPKIHNIVDGKAERSAYISCPEIARMAILNPEGLSFEKITTSYSAKDAIEMCIETTTKKNGEILGKYFWDIRIMSLSILQNREYSLDQRLILLGILFQNINDLVQRHETNHVPAMISTFEEMIRMGEFDAQLNATLFNSEVQMSVIRVLLKIKQTHGISSYRYLQCFTDTVDGLGLNDESHKTEKLDFSIFSNFIAEKEYMLENYVVNEFFKELMPFGRFNNIWDSYIFLCVQFSMVKIHLWGMSLHQEELTDEMVVKLIQSFSKEVAHNAVLINQFIEVIRDSGFNTLEYMAVLTKYPASS